jgi:hypothetical protein
MNELLRIVLRLLDSSKTTWYSSLSFKSAAALFINFRPALLFAARSSQLNIKKNNINCTTGT